MKILYAIQGTGNGHLARATEIIPILQEWGEPDILVSGIQGDIQLPFHIKYKFYGLSFVFGKKGGIDWRNSLASARPFWLFRDICSLPLRDYDLVISDFEPVSAWACKLRGVKCVGLSHQNAVLHATAFKPAKNNWLAKIILRHYAPTSVRYGFHFKALDATHFSPVIRSAIRHAQISDKGHYTVYLPAFSDIEIQKILEPHSTIKWQVFSKNCRKPYKVDTIQFSPVSLEGFQTSFVSCTGILCTSGFETPAEAIFMGKKLCVIPMKNQYEQACNAAFLAEMGISVAENSHDLRALLPHWLADGKRLQLAYPNITREIIALLVKEHGFADCDIEEPSI